MLFSQRKGLKPVKQTLQIDSMDDDLRNGLWNALSLHYWDRMDLKGGGFLSQHAGFETLFKALWLHYFKIPLDTLEDYWPSTYKGIREYFFGCKWYEVYDFIEFVANNYPSPLYDELFNQKFMDYCNSILEQELSAYRFVGGKITEITTPEEISEIEEALSTPFKGVRIHLKSALDKMSDRKNPDYRNSIKESISAVESLVQLMTKNPKAELGEGLKLIESKVGLHSALKKAFSSLYGYTSDADGIRHALLEESNLTFVDAKFMLVCCSAFVNYLTDKIEKAKIKI